MSPQQKMETKGKLYDKYVVPYYKSKGANLPAEHREMFIKAGTGLESTISGKAKGENTLDQNTGEFLQHMFATTGKQGVKVERAMGDAAYSGMHAVMDAFTSDKDWSKVPAAMEVAGKINKWIDKDEASGHAMLNQQEDQFNAFLGDKYSKSLMVKAAELPIKAAGSFTATMARNPEYLAAPEVVGVGAEGLLGKGALNELMTTGSVKSQMAYRAIKGAAEGYLVGKTEGEKGSNLTGTAVLFGELEAAGPVVKGLGSMVKESSSAQGAIKFLSKLAVWGGPSRVATTLEAAAKATDEQIAKADPNKITTKVVQAGKKVIDEVKAQVKQGPQRDARGRFVAQGVKQVMAQANKEAAIHNPELVKLQVAKDVKEWAANPMGSEFIKGLQKLGIDPIEANTEHVLKATKMLSGDTKVIKATIINEIGKGVDKFIGLGPGAASVNEADITQHLINLVETHIPMESKAQTLTFMWGIRENLPQEAQGALAEKMKHIYGTKIKTWDAAAQRLDKHMDQMIASGHINPIDKRGVFRSTKLTGKKTEWQNQLAEEAKTAKEAGTRKSTRKALANQKETAQQFMDRMLPRPGAN